MKKTLTLFFSLIVSGLMFAQSDSVTNTINFTADLNPIIGIGAGGHFDPDQDSIKVNGLDWDGLGVVINPEDRVLQEGIQPGIFTTSLTVFSDTLEVGDSTKWKFFAFPGANFGNGGWETGQDRWIVYQGDGAVINLPVIVPRIYPLFDALTQDVDVTFNVDMNGAIDYNMGVSIPLNQIQFVGMRGGADFLGSWESGGCWCPLDTTTDQMYALTDAGGGIFTRTVTVPQGTQGGVFDYKFGCMWDGIDSTASEFMDNENGFGSNHQILLIDGPSITLWSIFGSLVSVEKLEGLVPDKFALEQNYPNPFNPSTTIRYTITEPGLVNLKVYNLVGEEVKTLVNKEQSAGVYETTFDASFLPSGIYFYTIKVGDLIASKKMILLK